MYNIVSPIQSDTSPLFTRDFRSTELYVFKQRVRRHRSLHTVPLLKTKYL